MKSFREFAFEILKKSGKPLHSKKITEIAIEKGLKTNGKTPWATMNAILITDVNSKKDKSKFIKSGSSLFSINAKAKFYKTDNNVRTPLKEDFVKESIIKYLSTLQWGHFEFGGLHTHGVDIKAKKIGYSRYIFIEVKGSSELRQSDEVGFVYSLGQIITRMKDNGSTRNYYAIGLPDFAAKIAIRRLPWQVAKKLLLNIYSVNSFGEVEEYTWKELQKSQIK